MPIKVGDRLPETKFRVMGPEGPAWKTTDEVFKGRKVALFAEGPTPEWALPLPERIAGAPAGAQRFAFALDGLPHGASAAGAALKLTAVADGAAVEVTYRVD